MKTCTKCGETKPLEMFTKGRVCRTCNAAYLRQYRVENKEVLNQKQRDKWAARGVGEREAERLRAKRRHWQNHEAQLERGRKYYAENRERVLQRQCAYNSAQREEMARRMREWRAANPEKAKAAKIAYYSRMRRLPPWADKDAIADVYRHAKELRAIGVDCHVDHIVPLRGKTVSGLHTHNNLRVVLASENLKKNAKLIEGLL